MTLSRLLFCLFLLTISWSGQAANPIADALEKTAAEQAYLEPDQAFKLEVIAQDKQTLIADFKVAPGYYLYRQRITFNSPQFPALEAKFPKGEIKQDPNFGESEVYHQPLQVVIQLGQGSVQSSMLTLNASYQGCSEQGLCYSPIKKALQIALPESGTAQAPAETDRVSQVLGSGKLWLVALAFFGFGLLLSFTPCVFPMIPILSGIIVGQGEHSSRLHAFNLSLAYTLGMAVTYALAGIAAAYSGQLISNALQNPWALGFGAVVFVALALSMFDIYELRLPSALETRVANTSNRIKGGRFAGVFGMGALSSLLVSPCVAAPLAGALLYIGKTHDVLLGGVALFCMALGMGIPLLAIGLSAGAILPRAGAWMTAVRNFFGIVMLAMAIWLISPVIPVGAQMGLWAALLIGVAIFLSALDGLPPHAGHIKKLGKAIGIIALITGVAMLAGALAGSRNPLQPLAGLVAGNKTDVPSLPFKRIANLQALDDELKNTSGKPVMLDFYADWCVSCKEYEHTTFSDPRVQKALGNMMLLQADVTNNNENDLALLARFGLYGPPGIIFFDPKGQEITATRIVGYQNAEQFLISLNRTFAAQDGNCKETTEC